MNTGDQDRSTRAAQTPARKGWGDDAVVSTASHSQSFADRRANDDATMTEQRLQLQALLPARLRDKPWLSALSLRQHDLPPRTTLYRMGTQPGRIYFVAKGWIACAVPLGPRARPVSALRIRGDIIGLATLNGDEAVEEIETVTGAELISVPTHEYRDHMRDCDALTDFTFAEMARDMSNLQLMNGVIGRMTAPDRLAYFLYLMLERSRRTFHGRLDALNLPLTQEEIGHVLGLTNVSVNRAFRRLEGDGLIRTGRHAITFLDEVALTERLHLSGWESLMNRAVARA